MIAILLLLTGIQSFSQKSVSFEIEKLSEPERLLYLTSSNNIFPYKNADIEKTSPLPDSLVGFGEHPFLTGILQAYKDHRPFVISPDIIWLLISQGFARHISNNAEEFRKDIVNFENKKDLVVRSMNIRLGDPKSNWEELFPQFVQQINDYTGKELTDILTADFTTTTPVSKIVSGITVMETVKAYFNYKVIIISCGIPRITIEGTIADWEKILEKTKYISKFKLAWWTDEMIPILEEIINARKGNFNKEFWMDMVKAHTETKYGSPTTIDGWIVKFFPYTKEGKQTGLKPITRIDSLASELVKVPFELIDLGKNQSYPMEFWAGFVGLSQNKNNFTLKPEIGWAVKNNTSFNPATSRFNRFNRVMDDLSVKNITAIPDDIYLLTSVTFLHLSFLKDVVIPDKLAQIPIRNLEITGKITADEEQRIIKLFPNTKIIINGKQK